MKGYPTSLPPQHQDAQPGKEYLLDPEPKYDAPWYKGSNKLKDKTVFITGGDSGIGRSVSILAAREGANIAIVYLNEDVDAKKTQQLVEAEGSRCIIIQADVSKKSDCERSIKQTIEKFKTINCLINNAAQQFPQNDIGDISQEQLKKTFETNIYAYFYTVQAALPFLNEHDTIINTTSVTAYRGSHHLLDYASTKGAIVAFTRSLSQSLAEKKIRVNAVAPGPVWTPLIASTFDADTVASFGTDVPLGRPGQPEEIAPAFIYLASQDSSYMTGQVLHPNGGEIINT